MAKNNHSIGNAGEFYVLAQLAQRGYIAGKTDDGQTLIDVIATDPETLKSINIQVKTRDGAGDAWLMSAKNEGVFDGLWLNSEAGWSSCRLGSSTPKISKPAGTPSGNTSIAIPIGLRW